MSRLHDADSSTVVSQMLSVPDGLRFSVLAACARFVSREGRGDMSRFHQALTTALLVAFIAVAFPFIHSHAQDRRGDAAGNSVQVAGDSASLKIDAHHATIEQVLSALAGVDIGYRSSEGLDDTVDGIYTGSDRQVLARILEGYNYAIKQERTKLEVIVFGKSGDHAVPAAIVIPIRRRPSD
jgi:hypothetical protein